MTRIRSTLAGLFAAAALLATSGCDQIEQFTGKREAALRIESVPTGAVITVNGKPRGDAPLTIEKLAPGRHLILAKKEGHHDTRKAVTLAAGEQRTVTIELPELSGLVLVHSVPEDAEVTLNGSFRGKTPLLMSDFPAGEHKMRIAKPGFFTKDLDVAVKDRTPQLIRVDLTSDAAGLTVNSTPPGATVLINGANRGTTPARIEALPSGDSQIELRLDGFERYRQGVKISAGQSVTVDAKLTPLPGDLEIVTTPAKARVYVDNQLKGDSPVTLMGIAPGDHRVRIELKGFETDARSVSVKAGGKTTEEFRLVQNSGVLVLVTEPGGVNVLVDGEEVGETKPAAAGAVSQSFEVRYLGPGDHTLQLVRPGWTYKPTRFTIETGKAVTLHERMARLFIPDIRIKTLTETITGVLLKEFASGDLEIEKSPGIIVRIQTGDIVEREAIKLEK